MPAGETAGNGAPRLEPEHTAPGSESLKHFRGEQPHPSDKYDLLLQGLDVLGEAYSIGLEKRQLLDELTYLENEAKYHAESLGQIKKKERAILDIRDELLKADAIMRKYDFQKNSLIQVLLDVQETFRWLPRHILNWISGRLNIPLREIYIIANFYEAFSLEPRGRHIVQVCTGTACHVRGASEMLTRVSAVLGIQPGQTDSKSGIYAGNGALHRLLRPGSGSSDRCAVLSRSLAEQARKNHQVTGERGGARMSRLETPADLDKLREQIVAQRNAKQTWLAVCAGTGCRAYGAEALADSLEEEIEKRGLGDKVGVRRTGCHGFCERGPLVVIQPSDVCYLGAQMKNVPAIIDSSSAPAMGRSTSFCIWMKRAASASPIWMKSRFTNIRSACCWKTTCGSMPPIFSTTLPSADIPRWQKRFPE